MDHPWRFPPGGGTDLCPVCTAPHFPFCPPPPLPPHPFPYDLHPPPPPPPPQYHAPFHPPPPPMWGPPGPHPYDLVDMEGPHKRMRVGDAPPFDPYPSPSPPMLGRASVEGDRLLDLIREHGHGRPQMPPAQWHGEPYPPDGFGYGGDRGYPPPPPPQNYSNPYEQGGNFADYDLVRRMPPPPPPFDRHSAFESGFVPVGGSQEAYLDRDHHHRQFYPEATHGAPPLPSVPQHAEEGNQYDSRDWGPHSGVVPPPPDPPVPSPPDYHAMPPLRAANVSLFPVLSSSLATTSLPTSDNTLHQSHPVPDTNCYNEVHFPLSKHLDALLIAHYCSL